MVPTRPLLGIVLVLPLQRLLPTTGPAGCACRARAGSSCQTVGRCSVPAQLPAAAAAVVHACAHVLPRSSDVSACIMLRCSTRARMHAVVACACACTHKPGGLGLGLGDGDGERQMVQRPTPSAPVTQHLPLLRQLCSVSSCGLAAAAVAVASSAATQLAATASSTSASSGGVRAILLWCHCEHSGTECGPLRWRLAPPPLPPQSPRCLRCLLSRKPAARPPQPISDTNAPANGLVSHGFAASLGTGWAALVGFRRLKEGCVARISRQMCLQGRTRPQNHHSPAVTSPSPRLLAPGPPPPLPQRPARASQAHETQFSDPIMHAPPRCPQHACKPRMRVRSVTRAAPPRWWRRRPRGCRRGACATPTRLTRRRP